MKTLAYSILVSVIFLTACKKENQCIDPMKINNKIGCIEIYEPVCGCDGKTYDNVCYAENYGGVTNWVNGPCKGDKPQNDCIDPNKVDPYKFCPENIDFVCGCDNVTYNNTCNAERNGVTKWTKGPCKTTTAKIDTIYEPCIEVCQDSCVTLGTPRYILMQVNPVQSTTTNWISTNPNSTGTGQQFTVCPNNDTKVYLQEWSTQCKIGKKPMCGFGDSTEQQNKILPGGCVIPPPIGFQRELKRVVVYCFRINNCQT